ncbi:hypothetical protein [Halegenticoccus tardaugens]|uniref:hypothetical protein n=1 Tax=Halegenticoccus tardaugens TaxID=2071624 RepID=UPI0013E985FC|nr:hypothetical protein [Halegenticoccus tardaugens]
MSERTSNAELAWEAHASLEEIDDAALSNDVAGFLDDCLDLVGDLAVELEAEEK